MSPLFIGIGGGTGSGKTHLSELLIKEFGAEAITRIELDCYYIDQPQKSFLEKQSTNFDHPESIDIKLLKKHLEQLSQKKKINIPKYDFSTHSRLKKTNEISPKKIIIVEGILTLYFPEISKFLNMKVFLDVDADIRVIRRLKRDVKERGRDLDSVIQQYLHSVRPMHNKFIEPSKKSADLIISNELEFVSFFKRIKSLL